MAHIASLGAGMYSALAVTSSTVTAVPGSGLAGDWQGEFGSAAYDLIPNVREFPALGTPANIVNVPVFGSSISRQVQGQADAPSLEVQINYVPEEWTALSAKVGDGIQYAFRFSLLNAQPDGFDDTALSIGSVQNSSWYWIGKMEAFLVNPQLTDSNTATLTLSVQTDFYGAFTI